MNRGWLVGLNALAVILAGCTATLTTWQVNGHEWTTALVAGGLTTSIAGLGQLAKYGIVAGVSTAGRLWLLESKVQTNHRELYQRTEVLDQRLREVERASAPAAR